MSQVVKLFPDTHMSLAHHGLIALAREAGLEIMEMPEGDLALFLNRPRTAMKIMDSNNVIETVSNSSNKFTEHKAGFPVVFPLWVIEKMDFADLVYDPFCGTGSTLIACEKLNRRCFGMEIDPNYCSVIIKRWQDYTGQKAEKI